ncbi:MAG: PepSY-associated TM helix domain-containing protein [Tannerella sp.]|jgi:hypothetical protein|nr:PepSY-associated TM helix domain-containing protein [Tannerella sp.]
MIITRWLRIIHRDLGFLMVGISLVYGISGIYLNHLHGSNDPAFRTEEKMLTLPAAMTVGELEVDWSARTDVPKLKKIMPVDNAHYRLMLDGGIGVYSVADGRLDYEVYHKRFIVYWLNRLHYNKVKGWLSIADIFACSLIFLALSGIFIVRGKRGIVGSGKWWLMAGLAVPVIYVIINIL